MSEFTPQETKLLKMFINKPSVMKMLIDYPQAVIKDGLFDNAYKVCKYYNITIEDLVCKKRDKEFVQARKDFIHLCIKKNSCTKFKISKLFLCPTS